MVNSVEVVITQINATGIFVSIPARQQNGIIRWPEVTWDKSIEQEPFAGSVGQKLTAVAIAEQPNVGKYINLSLRQLHSPWEEAAGKYRVEQIVMGEVVGIRHFGVFVQLEPGIDAVIWPSELPLFREQLPEDIIAIGDKVCCIIIEVDEPKKQIRLSIIKYLATLDYAQYVPDINELPQMNILSLPRGTQPYNDKMRSEGNNQSVSHRTHTPQQYTHLKNILIIDDNVNKLQEIKEFVQTSFTNVDVTCVQNGEQGSQQVQENQYELILIDILLDNESGILVADQLLEQMPSLCIIFMSDNPLANDRKRTSRTKHIPFSFKENLSLLKAINNLLLGRVFTYTRHKKEDNLTFISQLDMVNVADHSSNDTVQQLLEQLSRETRASHTMVIKVDSINKSANIIAACPPMDENWLEEIVDGLYYSPIRNVVEEDSEFSREYINQEHDKAFRYFFPLLRFQSCLGIPLRVPGFPTHHALFLLFEDNPIIPMPVHEKALIVTQLIEVALQQSLWLDYMRRYEQRYLLGQLLGSFVHELLNRLDALGSSLDSLPILAKNIAGAVNNDERTNWLSKLDKKTEMLFQVRSDLKDLVNAYSYIAHGDLEDVDVNKVAEKIKLQLDMRAREASTHIILKLGILPSAQAITSRLEQALLNITLNAIQQIDIQHHKFIEMNKARDTPFSFPREGIVVIQTRFNPTNPLRSIQLIVTDTGPGINYYRQKEIFLMDTSMREQGHGLGLFISRSLIEMMKGQLYLADSILFTGSVFVIELPIFEGAS